MQRACWELDLIPAKVHKLGRPKSVPVRDQEHRRVAMPPAVLPGGVHEALDLGFGQVLSGSQVGVRRARGSDCSIYGGWRDQLQVLFGHVLGPPSLTNC